jgi:hypothetical protein
MSLDSRSMSLDSRSMSLDSRSMSLDSRSMSLGSIGSCPRFRCSFHPTDVECSQPCLVSQPTTFPSL